MNDVLTVLVSRYPERRDFAGEVGIAPSNAAVRVFRARKALEREIGRACGSCAVDGCSDCTCDGGA